MLFENTLGKGDCITRCLQLFSLIRCAKSAQGGVGEGWKGVEAFSPFPP